MRSPKLAVKNCLSISTTTVLTMATFIWFLLICYFWGNIYFFFSQVHEVMKLGKQLGASYIRRLLAEACVLKECGIHTFEYD